jgi:type VI secretion system secreted protein Hcp
MAIYMKIEGSTKIDGPVTVKGFEKQIELATFNIGGSRHIPQQTKSDQNRSSDEPQVGYANASKQWDGLASAKLFESLVKGVMDMTATVTFTSANDGGPLTYQTVKLTNMGLTSYSMHSTGGPNAGVPSESLTMSFTKIEFTPYTVGSDKKPVKGGVVSFDLPTGAING